MLSAAWIYFTTDIVRNRKNTHTWTVVIVGGARGRGKPRAFVLAPGCSPTGKILVAIKCPLVTIDMLRCDLLNIIFCKATHIFVIFFAFPVIKRQANLRLPLNVQMLKMFQLHPLTMGCVSGLRYTSFRCTKQRNTVDIWSAHTKDYCPCALVLSPRCSQL